MTEPNNRFIEILPEAALRIGIVLENEYITKYAFSILVAEQALLLPESYRDFSRVAKPCEQAFIARDKSRLGRPLGDVDEDWTNLIQYAAHSFAARIHQQVRSILKEDLAWGELGWLAQLPEYQKLNAFRAFLSQKSATTQGQETSESRMAAKHLELVDKLCLNLKDFVRARIFHFIRVTPSYPNHEILVNDNRIHTQKVTEADQQIRAAYDDLYDEEKVFLQQVWAGISNLDWTMEHHYDVVQNGYSLLQIKGAAHDVNIAIDKATREMKYNGGVSSDLVSEPNIAHASSPTIDDILISYLTKDYAALAWNPNTDGSQKLAELSITDPEDHHTLPSPKRLASPTCAAAIDEFAELDCWNEPMQIIPRYEPAPPTIDQRNPNWVNKVLNWANSHSSSREYTQDEIAHATAKDVARKAALADHQEAVQKVAQYTTEEKLQLLSKLQDDFYDRNTREAGGYLVPRDEDYIPSTSILFSVTRLFFQVRDHLIPLCAEMMSQSAFQPTRHVETLVSLSDKEFALLPLWAGGMNDGSGGVFATEVPFAERGAPNQPGPSYHTGSTLNSAANSEMDFDGESFSFVSGSGISEGGDTSMGVENGEEDRLPRGVVVSAASEDFVEDFASELAFSLGADSDFGMVGVESTQVLLEPAIEATVELPKSGQSTNMEELDDDTYFFNNSDGDDDGTSTEGETSDGEEGWSAVEDDEGEETETEG